MYRQTLLAGHGNLHRQVENAKVEVIKPSRMKRFSKPKSKRLAEFNEELDMDWRRNKIVDELGEHSDDGNDAKICKRGQG